MSLSVRTGRCRSCVKVVHGHVSSARRAFCSFIGHKFSRQSPPALAPIRRSSFTSRRLLTSVKPTSGRARRALPGVGATAPLMARTCARWCAAGAVTRLVGDGLSRNVAVGSTGAARSAVTAVVNKSTNTSVVRCASKRNGTFVWSLELAALVFIWWSCLWQVVPQ